MQPFTPLTQAQFQYVAMGKARGFSWDTLATQVNLPLVVLECLPWTHEKLWNRHLTKAERLVARETITEVADVLRRDVRHAEPHLHATLANSLTRVLKLQQEFAPPRRPRPVINTPNPPTPTPEVIPTPPTTHAKPTVGPPLGATVASLLGFFLLLGALLFMGCWNKAQRRHEHAEYVACAPFMTGSEPVHEPRGGAPETSPAPHVVLPPPPWVREHER